MNESPEIPAPPPDPYRVAWADLRRRRMKRWIVFLAWAPTACLCGVVCHAIAGDPFQMSSFLVGIGAVVLVFRYGNFSCPSCGKRFERRGFQDNPFTQRCLHCGISRGTPKSDVPG